MTIAGHREEVSTGEWTHTRYKSHPRHCHKGYMWKAQTAVPWDKLKEEDPTVPLVVTAVIAPIGVNKGFHKVPEVTAVCTSLFRPSIKLLPRRW